METFRARAAASYLDIFRGSCQNRCRIRRTLCHTLLDWDSLQFDAEELDAQLRELTNERPIVDSTVSNDPIYSFPLSSWAYFYKLRQMEWVLQLGFELETYQPDELAGMYWYLQYVARTRSRHLERIRGFTLRNYSSARNTSEVDTQRLSQFGDALAYINYSMLESSGTYGFADALSCLYTVLGRLSLIPRPPRPYSDDAMRYELRMKPFLSIALPEPVPFSEFAQVVDQTGESVLDLLAFASESTLAARRAFEVLSKLSAKDAFCQGSYESWLKDVRNCLKACIFTNITISAVKKAIEASGKGGRVKIKVEVPTPDQAYHNWWIVPTIVPIS